MVEPPPSIHALTEMLTALDGQSYQTYQALLDKTFHADRFLIHFVHIQGSPGAFPASVGHLVMDAAEMGLDRRCLANSSRTIATADYILRAFDEGIASHARQNRGAQGSGSFQPNDLPPQVLQRNLVHFGKTKIRIAFHISLPGSPDNRVIADQAVAMVTHEMAGIVHSLRASVSTGAALQMHCDVAEDMMDLQNRLSQYQLVAFVGDGAILPRQSGVSQLPLETDAVEFCAPDDLAVQVDLPNAGRVRGMGIRPGVNVVIGGAYHGKSTLLQALAKGVYPHIPGDGRERVVTHPDAVVICAEEGRAVTGLDISGFIDNLPSQQSTHEFSSRNASGSTSQAAATMEALQAGAKLLLIDEDTSAANFLAKDQIMRRLIPEDTITPLLDRVRELDGRWGVSALMVLGGSSAYLGAADHVVAMRNYRPVNLTRRAKQLELPLPSQPPRPLEISDNRRVSAENFDPRYHARRLGKTIAVRIKPLRLQPAILEYGDQQLDLTRLPALVDPHQVTAIGYALLQAGRRFGARWLSPSDLVAALEDVMDAEGLDALLAGAHDHLALARPRRLDLAAAINRLRNLQVKVIAD